MAYTERTTAEKELSANVMSMDFDRYIAWLTHTTPKTQPREKAWCVCQQCGRDFYKRANSLYCSPECRDEARREIKKAGQRYRKGYARAEHHIGEERICVICGNTYNAVTLRQKACSFECSKVLSRQNSRRWYEAKKQGRKSSLVIVGAPKVAPVDWKGLATL